MTKLERDIKEIIVYEQEPDEDEYGPSALVPLGALVSKDVIRAIAEYVSERDKKIPTPVIKVLLTRNENELSLIRALIGPDGFGHQAIAQKTRIAKLCQGKGSAAYEITWSATISARKL